MNHRRRLPFLCGLLLVLAGGVVPGAVAQETPTIRLLTHEFFFLPEAALDPFETATGARLEVLQSADTGSMVSQAILTADHPIADVLYGIDDTFLSRALDADIFEPWSANGLDAVPDELKLDSAQRVTPIDVGEVCLNLDRDAFGEGGLPTPVQLEDLLAPELRSTLVVEDPATSSPGLAFLLATIVRFGDDEPGGWRDYWRGLRANDVLVTSGWQDAYNSRFSGGPGDGDRPIVVSYATSPVAEVVFAPAPTPQVAPTTVLEDGCFRQVELAGILRGTTQPALAGALIDHLLSPEVQAELPLAMFVRPARTDVALPDAFVTHGVVPQAPLTMDPAAIAAGRDAWIAEWTEIVLR